jgi:hypothetical protein
MAAALELNLKCSNTWYYSFKNRKHFSIRHVTHKPQLLPADAEKQIHNLFD